MQTLDVIAISAYLAVLLVIGYFSSRKETMEGYLIGGRNLGAINSALSILASKIGGGMIIALIAYVYMFGASAYLYFVGAIVGYILFYFFAVELKQEADKNKFYTLTDYFEAKFGKPGVVWFTWMMYIANILTFSMQVVGGGKIIEQVTGFGFGLSVVLMMAITLTYIVLGGFRAVVFTDIFQAGIMIVLLLGITGLFSRIGSLSQTAFDNLGIPLMIGFFLFGVVLPFSSMELWQRVYATKDLKTAKRSIIISIGFYAGVGALLTVMGIAIRNLLPGIDPDVALLEGFIRFLPAGLQGLGTISLLAIVMSSADTFLFNCGSIFVHDIIRSKKNDRRIFSLGFGIATTAGLAIAISFQSVIDIVILYGSLFVVMAVLVMMSWKFKLNKKYMPKAYMLMFLLSIVTFLVAGVKVETAIVMIFVSPLSYLLAKLLD